MTCPNCGTENDPNNRFCMRCGTILTPAAAAPAPVPPAPAYTPPPPAYGPPPQPVYAPPPQPVASPPSQPAAWGNPPPPTYAPPTAPQPGYPMQPQTGYPMQPAGYGMPSMSTLNIWGPFAGYGTRRRHAGWLMDGQGGRAPEVITRVEAKFREREVPGAMLTKETLVARGLIVEQRPYFILRRGLASVALYITQFGHDLFISLASYLKPPISNFRAIVAGVMVVYQLFMTLIYPAWLFGELSGLSRSFTAFGSSSSSGGGGGLLFLLCIAGPLGTINGLALLVLACFSVYKWLSEKDFWAALRVAPNEFNEDDLMAMEKAVEETVRQSLTDIKLNPDDLQSANVGRGGQLF